MKQPKFTYEELEWIKILVTSKSAEYIRCNMTDDMKQDMRMLEKINKKLVDAIGE